MTDTAAKNAEKTHILWASNMDDLGYADILFLVGDEPPYGVGINCGGHIIVKPLRDWHALAAIPAPAQRTPGAVWREQGQIDPHGTDYDCERAKLALGHLSDDQIANNVFLDPNIVNLTAAKERIRWLSRALSSLPSTNCATPAPHAEVRSKEDGDAR